MGSRPAHDGVAAQHRADPGRHPLRGAPPAARPPGAPGGRVVVVAARVGLALGAWALRERGRPTSRAGLSRRLRRAFERLGPTYIKLGQIVSSGEGIFPEELVTSSGCCATRCRRSRSSTSADVIEDELGRPLEAVFAHDRRDAARGGVDRAGPRGHGS